MFDRVPLTFIKTRQAYIINRNFNILIIKEHSLPTYSGTRQASLETYLRLLDKYFLTTSI